MKKKSTDVKPRDPKWTAWDAQLMGSFKPEPPPPPVPGPKVVNIKIRKNSQTTNGKHHG